MFSDEDAKDIFQLFPPQKSSEFFPSLILSSGGHGFVTLEFIQAQFRSRVCKEPKRIPVSKLASELDVDPALIIQLVRNHSGLALLSADNGTIITLDEREALQEKLYSLSSSGLISKSDFALRNDLDVKSVSGLLSRLDGLRAISDDYVCGKDYEHDISVIISGLLESSLETLQSIDIMSERLPGTPPSWFILQILERIMASQQLTNEFCVKTSSSGVQCYSKQLITQNREAVTEDLRSGKLAYVELQAFWKDFQELHPTYEDAQQYIQNAVDVEIMDSYAIPTAWLSTLVETSTKTLEDEGRLDLVKVARKFPDSQGPSGSRSIGERVLAKFQQEHNAQAIRFGSFLVTPETISSERQVLLDYAEVDAGLQWQRMQESPEKEVKYSLSNIRAMMTIEQYIPAGLITEKAVQKAIEEQFWTSVLSQETQNEAQFSEVWTDRVVSRCHIYNDGLTSVEDQKLCDQLSNLFALYILKELVPDTIAKARSQGFVLSRKTRKYIGKLESAFHVETATASDILSTLKKFDKKQGIEPLDDIKIREAKQAMVNDMIRRMQKQKASDGPVLFLTLTLILFAKHYDAVVYATGKFAPKLLKQLKSVLPAEQYAQVEKWKEAAKTSTLSADDRAAMKQMAEA